MRFFEKRLFSISFLLSMAMVSFEVSPIIVLFSFAILVWKWGSETFSWKPLSRKLSNFLSVVLLATVWLHFKTLVGQEPAFSFLLGLAALRVSDYRSERDHKFIVLLGLILIAARALFSLDIYWLIPSGIALFGLLYSLLPEKLPHRFSVLFKVLILSVPVTTLLFLVFPRVVMPWAISRGQDLGHIGFSDDMNPGSVAEIAANSQVAFRAKLSELPFKRTQDLYWRGVVLQQSDGLSWKQGVSHREDTPPVMRTKEFFYDIALEATGQNYLFALDGTRILEMEFPGATSWAGGIFKSRRALQKTTFYRGYWEPSSQESAEDILGALQVPELSERTRNWVLEVSANSKDPEARLRKIQELFMENGFAYSLKPGFYTANGLDDFLFNRKVGFCEHFAGAYATLARALGIPARVVIGYQGGFYNPLGDFWKIGQKDAHAWVEVAINNSWQRIDPTAWVAPLRFIIGAEAFFSLSEEDQRVFARNLEYRPTAKINFLWWQEIEFFFEDLNYRWNYFLLDFDRQAQKEFLQSLTANWEMLGVSVALLLAAMVFLLRNLLSGQRRKKTEAEKLLALIEAYGELAGRSRLSFETPLCYLDTLKDKSILSENLLEQTKDAYEKNLYQENYDAREIQQLLERWHFEYKKKKKLLRANKA
ncbi:putative cysteine protease (transglutaminase-like) protein [Bdellovibrio bacteriovorus W]|nr:putative cysteine protease (transglutaminase-like) protein [Bdellovibrio bacteriovorus W]